MSGTRVDLDPVASGSFRLAQVAIKLDNGDDVVIARKPLAPWVELTTENQESRAKND